jgi:aldose 1-epimerase
MLRRVMLQEEIALVNRHGERVVLSSAGAGIVGIFVRDRLGRLANVAAALGGSAGKTIGRYAGRIANGRFALDGHVYQLAVNEGRNTLHGGPDGFARRTWSTSGVRSNGAGASVEFTLRSDDGDQGFPGNLSCDVTYAFDDDGALRIAYGATTDAASVVNFTNHVYFDLSAGASPSIAAQRLRIAASAYAPVDRALIPTGAIESVGGTQMDFRSTRAIGTTAYDTPFVLDGWNGTLRLVAEASDDMSGRHLSVETTEPCLQLYTGKAGGYALETQHLPDSPNHPQFPSTALRPGQTFRSVTVYRFSAPASA